jgi:hypothetical protein
MVYLEALFKPTNGAEGITPAKFRETLAASNAFPGRLFHYLDNGYQSPKFVDIRFGKGRGRAPRIVAIGEEAGRDLYPLVAHIGKIAGEQLGCGKSFDTHLRTGLLEIHESKRLIEYFIPKFAFQQKPYIYKKFESPARANKASTEMLRYIDDRIKLGIRRQAEFAGIVSQLEECQWIQGDVAVNGDIHPVEIKTGRYCLVARNVSFRSNLNLTGPWACGILTARGYGEILRKGDHQ